MQSIFDYLQTQKGTAAVLTLSPVTKFLLQLNFWAAERRKFDAGSALLQGVQHMGKSSRRSQPVVRRLPQV